MKLDIDIVEDWRDDLLWCPSQCYLKFRCNGKHYVLYLRWRHNDPWTASLVPCSDSTFNMHEKDQSWIELDVKFWKDTELNRCKLNAISLVKKKLLNT